MSGPKPRPVRERILESIVITDDGCWEWQKFRQRGYGRIWVGSRLDGTRRLMFAHRAAYEAFLQPIPDDLPLDHLCRNPPCCNPQHLEPVTYRDNFLRGEHPSAQQSHREACGKGHEFTDENTYMNQGKRYCRKCHGLRAAGAARVRPRL